MVEAGQDVAADLGLGQGGADGGGQPDGLQGGMHLEGDPGRHEVVVQAQGVGVGPRQHHGQALGLADGGGDVAGQRSAVRPQGVDVLALADHRVHGRQQGVQVLFSGSHGASLGGRPARPARHPARGRRLNDDGGRSPRRERPPSSGCCRLLGVGRHSFLGWRLGRLLRRRSRGSGSRLGSRRRCGHEGAARVVQVHQLGGVAAQEEGQNQPKITRILRSTVGMARPW